MGRRGVIGLLGIAGSNGAAQPKRRIDKVARGSSGPGPGAQHARRPAGATEQGEQQHGDRDGEASGPEDLVGPALVDVSSS